MLLTDSSVDDTTEERITELEDRSSKLPKLKLKETPSNTTKIIHYQHSYTPRNVKGI